MLNTAIFDIMITYQFIGAYSMDTIDIPSLTEEELKRAGNIYGVHHRIDTHEFNSDTQRRNAQMRLMVFMQRFNTDHKGFEPNPKYFVRTYRDVHRFYHNAVKRIDTKSKQAGNDLKFQTASLKASDLFRRQVASGKARLEEGDNFTFVNRVDGLLDQVENEEVSRRYNDMWNHFAAAYPHPDYPDESEKARDELEKASLNSNLNDPGDTDHDGNTLNPAGTSARVQAYEDSIVPDVNGDGTIDGRDVDLRDGHVDDPNQFSEEELATLEESGAYNPEDFRQEPIMIDDDEPDFF